MSEGNARRPEVHSSDTLSATVVGALNNYNITNAGNEFTIEKRDATWTTNANSKTYGNADPDPLTTGSRSEAPREGKRARSRRLPGDTDITPTYNMYITF